MSEIFRPTAVQNWTRCPQKWYYESVGGLSQLPRDSVEYNPALDMGSALHAGIAAWWRSGSEDRAMLAAIGYLTTVCPAESLSGLSALLSKVLLKLILWCETNMGEAEVLLVDQALRPEGVSPDLVTREFGEFGDLVVTDWKYHHNVARENLHYRLEGPERNHQFLHYCWDVGEYFQEPVRLFRRVSIVGTPTIIIKDSTFIPTEPMLAEWLRQTKVKWFQMAQMKAGGPLHGGMVYRREDGCKPYGEKYPCEFWEACWTCHGDREKMKQFYSQGESK